MSVQLNNNIILKAMNKCFQFCVLIFFNAVLFTSQVVGGEVIQLTKDNLNLLPKGKERDGMAGDWIIKNDKVIAVLGAAAPDREANQMVSSIQGCVIDFTSFEDNNDQLTVFYPQGARVDVPAADTAIVMKGKGKKVQIKFIKYPTDREPYTAETIYTLKNGESQLLIETTYSNDSSSPLEIPVYDKLRCDNDLNDVAGKGNIQPVFIFNKWYHSAYGVASTTHDIHTSGKVSRENLIGLGYVINYSDKGVAMKEKTRVGPGQKVSISRYLFTGRDVAGIQFQHQKLTGIVPCLLNLDLKDANGKKIAEAFVDLKNDSGELVSAAITNKEGAAVLYGGQGEYTLTVAKPGHDTVRTQISVPSETQKSLVMKPQTKFVITATGPAGEEMPIKVEFRGVNATKNPSLGPNKRAEGAGNLYYTRTKNFEVPVQAGEYEIVFSHGPEYHSIIKNESISAGESKNLTVELSSAFETPGWIIADMHNHSTWSGDSHAEVEARVINMAAAGIEFGLASEHNRIADYTPIIKELGMEKVIASAAGAELSGRPGPGDINHQNAFPLKVQDGMRGYGAPKTDKDPYVQMKRLYDYDDNKFKVMQQNHPNIGWLYFDKDRDGDMDHGFGTAPITDVLEMNTGILDIQRWVEGGRTFSRLVPWLQMLNLGYRIYATANSDNHAIGHGSGSVYTYINTPNDKPENIDDIELARRVKEGHMVLTNGPFMDVRVNGALPGGEIIARNAKLNVSVKIYHANWCVINSVQLLINGKADSVFHFSKENSPELFKDGVFVFEKEIPVSLSSDAHIIVGAYGKDERIDISGGRYRNAIPAVVSNPVFVDIDGDGFEPSLDLLGQPLPTGQMRR